MRVFQVETLNYARRVHTQETTTRGIKNKKPETINERDDREKKKCSEISLIIISGGGPHCAVVVAFDDDGPETMLSGAGYPFGPSL